MSIGFEGRLLALSLLPRWLRRRLMERRYHREIDVTGEAELPYLRQMLKPHDLALDVGCNLGVYTYELSRITGNVVAFEPNPSLAKLVGGLGLTGVDVRQAAASDHAHQTELFIPSSRFGHGLATLRSSAFKDVETKRISVSAGRLDAVEGNIAFVKIDVEGFEEQVLAGAEGLLDKGRCIFLVEIEERHNAGGLVRITDRMRAFGYDGFFLHRDTWHPIAKFDVTQHQSPRADDPNGTQSRRALQYVNNFLFVPINRLGDLPFLKDFIVAANT